MILLYMFSLLSINGCADVREKAKSELAKKNIAFDGVSFVKNAELGDVETVKLFLNAGMDPNIKGENGRTPLHAAANFGKKDITEMLIAHKADVNARNDKGTTPLFLAVYNGHKDLIELLISKGAKVNINANDGVSPLMMAVDRGDWKVAELLINNGSEVNEKKLDGSTILHLACSRLDCSFDIVRLLVAKGTLVDSKNNKGKTPVDIAQSAGNKKIADYLKTCK